MLPRKKIDEGIKTGIIEKVDGISEWCSPMSFVPKPGGGIPSVGDLVQLNKFVDSQEGSKMNPRLSHSNLQFPGTKRPNQPQEPIWAGQPIQQPKPGLKTRYGPWQLLLKKSNKFVWD